MAVTSPTFPSLICYNADSYQKASLHFFKYMIELLFCRLSRDKSVELCLFKPSNYHSSVARTPYAHHMLHN